MKFVRISVIAVLALAAAAVGPAQMAMAGVQQTDSTSQVAFHLPYKDPDQIGWITLCNEALKPITHGSITAKPFVWRAVSSVRAPKAYRVKDAIATLFAYQPIHYLDAADWSGTQLSASSYYSNPAHPMVQFTPIDLPLTQMTSAYPPVWDHLIELRIYLSAPDSPADSLTYAAADLQISGNTWTMVAGGNGSCTDGKAISKEVLVNLPGANGSPSPAKSAAGGGSASSTPAAGLPSAAPSGSANAAPAANEHFTISGAALITIAVVLLAIVLLMSGGIWRRRRRRAAGF
jgi:hypothetical protein